MKQATIQQIVTDIKPSPVVVFIIFMMILAHAFVIYLAISAKAKGQSVANTLPIQITLINATQQTQSPVSTTTHKKTIRHTQHHVRTHHKDSNHHFKTMQSKQTAPIMIKNENEEEMADFQHTTNQTLGQKEHKTSDFISQTHSDKPLAPTDKPDIIPVHRPAPSIALKKAAQIATIRIIEAWENKIQENDGNPHHNYDTISGSGSGSGKKLMVTIQLDDTGGVMGIDIGKGNQELADDIKAAINDSAPFGEVAGMASKLTIEFNSAPK